MTSQWAQPQPIDDAMVAFPARVCGTLLPDYAEIPDEFKRHYNPWAKVVTEWFFNGLTGRLVPKDGIDYRTAARHLAACMGSFEPKHEHKTAGVAYLMSLWFDSYEATALPPKVPA